MPTIWAENLTIWLPLQLKIAGDKKRVTNVPPLPPPVSVKMSLFKNNTVVGCHTETAAQSWGKTQDAESRREGTGSEIVFCFWYNICGENNDRLISEAHGVRVPHPVGSPVDSFYCQKLSVLRSIKSPVRWERVAAFHFSRLDINLLLCCDFFFPRSTVTNVTAALAPPRDINSTN